MAITDRADCLTIQQVITFCRVYEQGGYSSAAESLDLTGPTIWEHVKTLEKIYQTKLFARSGRNILPTSRGDALYDMLRPLLASVESTFERLHEASDQFPKQISLVTGVRMMLEELGTPLRKFQIAFPDTKLKLMNTDNVTAQKKVLEGAADLALLIEPSHDIIESGIAYESLYPIEYLVALPPRHRLTRRKTVSLADLADEPMIVGNPQTIGRKMLEQARFRMGINSPLKIAAESDNSAVTIACVRAGLGVGIIAGRPDGNLTKHVTTRSLAEEIGQVHVVAAFREGRQLTCALQKLIELIRSDN